MLPLVSEKKNIQRILKIKNSIKWWHANGKLLSLKIIWNYIWNLLKKARKCFLPTLANKFFLFSWDKVYTQNKPFLRPRHDLHNYILLEIWVGHSYAYIAKGNHEVTGGSDAYFRPQQVVRKVSSTIAEELLRYFLPLYGNIFSPCFRNSKNYFCRTVQK